MLPIPKKCTQIGEYKCQVLMPINGRVHGIDYCISDIVAALNAANIQTMCSCCGHGKQPGHIAISDGREIDVHLNPNKGMI